MTTETPVTFPLRTIWGRARSLWTRVLSLGQRVPRRLRVSETVALGERRFVAIVEFEHSRFLLGGTSSSLVLLADLGNAQNSPDHAGGNPSPARWKPAPAGRAEFSGGLG